MPSRNRRVRLIALAVFGVIVFALYSRRSSRAGYNYRQYQTEQSIGGGAVLRPGQPEEKQSQDVPVAAGPEPQVELTSSSTQKTSTISHATTTSTSSTSLDTSSSSSFVPAPTPESNVRPIHETLQEGDLPIPEDKGRVEVEHQPATSSLAIYWTKFPEHFPISSTIQLPSGTSKPFPRIQKPVEKLKKNGADQEKLAAIKTVAGNAWKGYREFAFPQDEIKPISAKVSNPFNGWGATLVDSLDTLWVMGMKEEFEDAIQAVQNIDFTTSPRSDIPLFETTIRYLGGLIAAYDVSERKHIGLLDKAVELAEVLYAAFDTPNRVPQTYYRWKPAFASQPHRASTRVILAEIGTLSLEFTRLAQLTGEPKYYDAIARITDLFDEWQNSTRTPGMWPTTLDGSGCKFVPAPNTPEPPNRMDVPDGSGHQMVSSEAVQASRVGTNMDDLRQPGVKDALVEEKQAPGAAEKAAVIGPTKPTDPDEEADDFVIVDKRPSIQKRKLDDESDSKSGDEFDQISVESIANETMHKHELRTPPEFLPQGSGRENGRSADSYDDEDGGCVYQGLASTSKTGVETYTLSGASDSMYEYLPKMYIILGGLVEQYKSMYLYSAATAIEKLLYKPMTPEAKDILMTGDLKMTLNYTQPPENRGYIEKFSPEAAHLACFAGGMFAMGGVIFDKPEHVEIGAKLTDGCVWTYQATETGIMPEGAVLLPCEDTWGECPWNESAWWRALDPYEESRLQFSQAGQQKAILDATVPVEAKADQPMLQKLKASAAPNIQAQSKSKSESRDVEADAGDSGNTLAKRQLEKPSFREDDKPAAPAPASGPSAGRIKMRPDRPGDPPPIYTPPPPPSHEEFVEQKIVEERLPKGFVRFNFRSYILRPEAIESVFYMYRITGDNYWREVGWQMFTAIDQHTRALYGNSAIDDVSKTTPELMDQMESFWMAETLKYFYLLYDEPENWSLDDWVLNTEAHLFRRPKFEFKDEK